LLHSIDHLRPRREAALIDRSGRKLEGGTSPLATNSIRETCSEENHDRASVGGDPFA
jgi:hypothetical protein